MTTLTREEEGGVITLVHEAEKDQVRDCYCIMLVECNVFRNSALTVQQPTRLIQMMMTFWMLRSQLMISLLGEDSEDISMWQLLVQEAGDIVFANCLDEHLENMYKSIYLT